MLRVAVATLCVGAAAAQPKPRIAVLEVRAFEGVGPDAAEPLKLIVAGQLGRAGFDVIVPTDVERRSRSRPDLAGCARGACLDEIAGLLRADKLCGGALRHDQDVVAVDVWIYDATSRGSVAATAKCQACAPVEAPRLAEAAVRLALEKDAHRHLPAVLEVRSTPPGATVRVDGQAVGATPLSLRVPAGAHGVVVEAEGYRSETRSTAPESGQVVDLNFSLVPLQPLQPAAPPLHSTARALEPPRRGAPGWWKWAAWGGSIAALGAGAALLAIDGREISRTGDQTRELHETTAEGITLVGIGGALAATGVALWWKESP